MQPTPPTPSSRGSFSGSVTLPPQGKPPTGWRDPSRFPTFRRSWSYREPLRGSRSSVSGGGSLQRKLQAGEDRHHHAGQSSQISRGSFVGSPGGPAVQHCSVDAVNMAAQVDHDHGGGGGSGFQRSKSFSEAIANKSRLKHRLFCQQCRSLQESQLQKWAQLTGGKRDPVCEAAKRHSRGAPTLGHNGVISGEAGIATGGDDGYQYQGGNPWELKTFGGTAKDQEMQRLYQEIYNQLARKKARASRDCGGAQKAPPPSSFPSSCGENPTHQCSISLSDPQQSRRERRALRKFYRELEKQGFVPDQVRAQKLCQREGQRSSSDWQGGEDGEGEERDAKTFVSQLQMQLVFVPVSSASGQANVGRKIFTGKGCLGFDDSSSISSGEISDTINEISTDENLTGSSLSGTSSEHNPYGSLKRVPVPGGGGGGVPNNLVSRSLPSRSGGFLQPKTNNAVFARNVNLQGRDNLDNILGENWRKYCIGEDGEQQQQQQLSSGSLDRTGGIGGGGGSTKERMDGVKTYPTGIPGAVFIKKNKSNQATITDLRSRSLRNANRGTAIAVEDPNLRDGGERLADGHKRDTECNTDHSMMKRPSSRQGQVTNMGLRRPASSASNASTNSSKSNSSRMLADSDAVKGERLSNYSKGPMVQQRQANGVSKKTASGTQTGISSSSTAASSGSMGPEAYSASTLERKKKGKLVSSNTQTTLSSMGGTAVPGDYQSSTLGRKKSDSNLKEKLFGSRSSLTRMSSQQQQQQQQQDPFSTIISNPHATFTKDGVRTHRHSAGSAGSGSPGNESMSPTHQYVNVSMNSYLAPDYVPSRPLSGISSPTSSTTGSWSRGGMANGGMRMAMSETESMESLSSASSNIQAQIQQARAYSLASRNILQHANQQQQQQQQQPGLHRSDSFKSTKSEKVFPTSSHASAAADGLPRTNSFTQLYPASGAGPSSPTLPPHGMQGSSSRLGYPLSSLVNTSGTGGVLGGSLSRPNSAMSTSSPYANVYLPLSKLSGSRDDDLHGSSLSLISSSSSVYSTAEEKQAQEAHVVAAFEQSLSNMTHRLTQLTSTAEQKDSELNELRATIEALQCQSGIHVNVSPMRRQSSNASTLSNIPTTPGSEVPRLSRHMSSDSVSSLNSMSSACSAASQQSSATDIDGKKKKKKNWLRSSFSKAFSRKKGKTGSVSDCEGDTASLRSDASVPNSPLLMVPHAMSMPSTPIRSPNVSGMLGEMSQEDPVMSLQHQLHEKDMKLTEIRLESLTSAHQLEQLRETMNRMKNEMSSLKADNDRLQRLITVKGMSPSAGDPPSHSDTLEKRLSLGDPSNLDLLMSDSPDRDGRRISISVFLCPGTDFSKLSEPTLPQTLIGIITVSGKTKWDLLDSTVRRVFKEYVLRLDPVTNLGLNAESVFSYHIGEIVRRKEMELPELLPCGYLVGDNTNITLGLKGTPQNSVDALAFETLIPKSIVQRYISLLLEHRRIILCGPSGTGKTFLAQKLAEYLVIKSGKEVIPGSVATFNVDHKSSKELRQYLANIADQCESTSAGELPNVIILDNLHHVSSLGEVFNGFLNVKYQKCPYIIGTMNQTTNTTTNLQLHHNFRWVLCANHMEPVKGFLGRFLRRKLIEEEIRSGARNNDLNKIVDWMPKVWQHLNKFLETHSSTDVTIGPRLFLSCPMDVAGAQVWFTDLWNYSIVPYLLEAVREGIQTYGKRVQWEDPADWVIDSYPWSHQGEAEWPSLLRLRPEDVGYENLGAALSGGAKSSQAPQSDAEGDPLLNMLMRLQEAASYSSPQSNDSDSTSLDSHSSAQDFSSSTSSPAPMASSGTPPARAKTSTNSSVESTI